MTYLNDHPHKVNTHSGKNPHDVVDDACVMAQADSHAAPLEMWIDRVRQAQIPPLEKLICFTLAVLIQQSATGTECRVSIKDLVRASGLSKQSVLKYLKAAERDRLIAVSRHVAEEGAHCTNTYRIVLDEE